MSLTRLQAVNAVKAILAPHNINAWSDTTIIQYLDWGQASMCERRGIPAIYDSPTNQPLVTATSINIGLDLMSVKRLRIKDATTLLYTTLTDDDYRIWGQYLEFTTPKSGFLELICTVKPMALTSDTQLLDVPTGFDMGAVFYAVAMCGLGDESGFGASFMQQFLMKKLAWETDPGLETTYVYGLGER